MRNTFACCCRPCCRCFHPCTPCRPTTPTPAGDILVAAGTGSDPHQFIALTLMVPFGPSVYAVGDFIRHPANTPEFTVLTPGQYRISYQLAAYNPVLGPEFDIDIGVHLMSNLAGALDTVDITRPFQVTQRSVTANLATAEIVWLEIRQPYPSEMSVNSQAIIFTKLS